MFVLNLALSKDTHQGVLLLHHNHQWFFPQDKLLLLHRNTALPQSPSPGLNDHVCEDTVQLMVDKKVLTFFQQFVSSPIQMLAARQSEEAV